ncbi:MAG: type I polyketide synthase [Symploca sp. SIO1C4]|uniref:Type I polyketide synthase n=1 Tax=Symploca sp. SIO1C4 TaxID=2607765 RepID=A0A6B3NEH3_9CYAN|nr:type I polyketide synthase [Symploca sp. SIO1C4]
MDNYPTQDSLEGIAIIGVDGRFPGAKTVDQFWQNLRDGIESISLFTDQELAAVGIDSETLSDPNYVKAGSILSDIEMFDASFFSFSPREAKAMDPQHRLLLECAWGAMENAGYNSQTYDGKIGVYAGTSLSTYLHYNLLPHRDFLKLAGDLQIEIGNDKDFVPTRISYKMNLKGPSVCINTACSTSLVAVHLACQGLLDQECDMALAGGATIQVPHKQGYFYQEDGIASPDGHCRSFDAKAQGTIFGSGVGIVLLKRLEDAIRDRDHIYAVIRGSAINNDGSLKVGYTAPSVDGQAEAIAEAQALAEVDPETISYIEAHGTATGMGDPIEIAALTQVFRASTDKKGFCAIGSAKSNLGHLNRAAGVVGLIKTILALKHQMIPPSLHFEQPNPQIDFANSPFYVNTKLQPWQTRGNPRRAGVSSFGIGGTNAHAVLEEAPTPVSSGASRSWQLLLLSAKTDTALKAASQNLARHLQQNSQLNLADVAYTLQVGRQVFKHRRMLICQNRDEAISALEIPDPQSALTHSQETKKLPVAFMFSGQGAQYVNMALELYQIEPIFRQQVDICSELLEPHLKLDLRHLIYPSPQEANEATHQLKQTAITQASLFVIEYALARLWMSWGCKPQAMIGHSIGEYVAACLAGVFSLEDALRLVAARGQMMQKLPGGSLLAVFLPEQEIRPLLSEKLSLAAINAPSVCAVSGPKDAIETLEKQLLKQGIDCRHLHTSHAFHSQMMDPILGEFSSLFSKINLNPPQIPYISNVTGTWITATEATDPNYWAKHLRQTVHFSEGVQKLLQDPARILLEVGPGRTLKSLALQHPDASGRVVLSSVRHPKEQSSDVAFLLNILGQLWLKGIEVDWSGFYAHEQRNRLPLPTYPFERQRYWVEPESIQAALSEENLENLISRLLAPGDAKLSTQPVDQAGRFSQQLAQLLERANKFSEDEMKLLPKLLEVLAEQHQQHITSNKDWLYQIQWQPKPNQAKSSAGNQTSSELGSWLILADHSGIGQALAQLLKQRGQNCILVYADTGYQASETGTWSLNPSKPAHFERLFQEALGTTKLPLQGVIHLWSLEAALSQELTISSLEKAQTLSCASVLHLVQMLVKYNGSASPRLWLVSRGAVPIASNTGSVAVAQAPLWGLGKVVALEHPELWGGMLDLATDASKDEAATLLAEIWNSDGEDHLAFRDGKRYVCRLVPCHQTSEPQQLKFHVDGSYLITGGLGALGLKVAAWMVEQGARNLVLVGRSEASVQAKEAINQMKEQGAKVLAAQADVSNQEQMAQVLEQLTGCMPQLRGIIHAAGIAGYQVLQDMDFNALEAVLCPKVLGTWTIHQLTQEMKLDFFLCFSSIASVWGSKGQAHYAAANHFLDMFAHYRQGLGLPTLSVNWGPWTGGGMASEEIRTGLARMGVKTLPSEQGIEMLKTLLGKDLAQATVANVDWVVFKELYEARGNRLLLEKILPQPQALTQQQSMQKSILEQLQQNSKEGQALLLTTYLQEQVAKTLGLNASQLDTEQPLNNMGLDSLMAIELRKWITNHLNVDVPTAKFMEGLSVTNLVMHVSEQLKPAQSTSSTSTTTAATGEQKTAQTEINKGVQPSDAEQILANFNQLTDEEVDALLSSMSSSQNI